jgi:hypothetical protein
VNIDPGSGAIANAHWVKDGRSLTSIAIPADADGLVFAAVPGATFGTPLARPKAATGFQVFWSPAGRITAAAWRSVGKLLETIPVAPLQRAIAFTNGA